jgi:uncharacterized protein involved in tolerance to divalent cations
MARDADSASAAIQEPKQHPYEVPCVAARPITDGNQAYVDWIVAETREPLSIPANPERP